MSSLLLFLTATQDHFHGSRGTTSKQQTVHLGPCVTTEQWVARLRHPEHHRERGHDGNEIIAPPRSSGWVCRTTPKRLRGQGDRHRVSIHRSVAKAPRRQLPPAHRTRGDRTLDRERLVEGQ